jgi:hypothetical protein
MGDRTDPEAAAIEALVQDYFLGMYEGDVGRLRRIFHPQCWLFGENPRGSHAFPVAGFIDQIASEPVPEAEGEPFDMHLVSTDRTGSVAVAKVSVRYQGRRFTDYLTLQKAADGWRIVGKLFFSPD